MSHPNLIKCGDCGEWLSKRSANCPNCGAPNRRPFGWISILFWAGLIVAGVVAYQNFEPPKKTPAEAYQDSQVVERMQVYEGGKRAVTLLLKAPSTAKFPGMILDSDQIQFTRQAEGGVGVSAWVDAQNTFGAMIRHPWGATMKRQNGEWTLQTIWIDDQHIDMETGKQTNFR